MTQDRQSPTRRRPAAGRPVPVSTYRLQLCADLTFDDAAAQVPYLARLGVTHLYLSPVLTAAPGSTHGYDVGGTRSRGQHGGQVQVRDAQTGQVRHLRCGVVEGQVGTELQAVGRDRDRSARGRPTVSYTHLTLPTNREV